MLKAETSVTGRCLFFSQTMYVECYLIPETSKIQLWVPQPGDSEFANIPLHLVLSLPFPPVKWEKAPLTQRGFVWRIPCDTD